MDNHQMFQAINDLKPWRYSHSNGSLTIDGDPAVAKIEAQYDSRAEMVALIRAVLNGRKAEELRVLDLGCLEGHYTAAIASMGFREVVGVDISPNHLRRAEFLLGTFYGLKNYRLEQCPATDAARIEALGPFDIILCHGLLYHLKEPLMMFDVFEAVASKVRPMTVLLNTQFKGDFRTLVSQYPTAELQVKRKFRSAHKVAEKYIFLPEDQSVFERLSLRLNPSAVYHTLSQYGYDRIVGLDTPRGARYGYSVNLICQKGGDVVGGDPSEWLDLDPLKKCGVTVAAWRGRSVDGFHFDDGLFWKGWRMAARVLRRIFYRLTTGRLQAARKL